MAAAPRLTLELKMRGRQCVFCLDFSKLIRGGDGVEPFIIRPLCHLHSSVSILPPILTLCSPGAATTCEHLTSPFILSRAAETHQPMTILVHSAAANRGFIKWPSAPLPVPSTSSHGRLQIPPQQPTPSSSISLSLSPLLYQGNRWGSWTRTVSYLTEGEGCHTSCNIPASMCASVSRFPLQPGGKALFFFFLFLFYVFYVFWTVVKCL